MALRDELASSGSYLFRWRSYLPLLFMPVLILALEDFSYPGDSELLDNLLEVACGAVAVVGLFLRVLTVGYVPQRTSGRNTKQQHAEILNTTGLYSLVRHPLYLGNFLIWLGLIMFVHTWWLVLIGILSFWLYYERIMFAEEEFLSRRFRAEFEEWAARTPAFVPAFRIWRTPVLPFSWKAVLAREHATWFGTIIAFFSLELAGDVFAGKMPRLDLGWAIMVSAGTILYIVLRWMKKRNWLFVEGR